MSVTINGGEKIGAFDRVITLPEEKIGLGLLFDRLVEVERTLDHLTEPLLDEERQVSPRALELPLRELRLLRKALGEFLDLEGNYIE